MEMQITLCLFHCWDISPLFMLCLQRYSIRWMPWLHYLEANPIMLSIQSQSLWQKSKISVFFTSAPKY